MDHTASSAAPWCPSIPVCFPGDGQHTAYNVSPLQITQSEISVGCIPREEIFHLEVYSYLTWSRFFRSLSVMDVPVYSHTIHAWGFPCPYFLVKICYFSWCFSARKIGTKCWLIFIHLSPLITKMWFLSIILLRLWGFYCFVNCLFILLINTSIDWFYVFFVHLIFEYLVSFCLKIFLTFYRLLILLMVSFRKQKFLNLK